MRAVLVGMLREAITDPGAREPAPHGKQVV